MAKSIKVKTDEAKSYLHPQDAIADQGYSVRETRDGLVAEKDGKKYSVESYDHYNTTVYSVNLKEI